MHECVLLCMPNVRERLWLKKPQPIMLRQHQVEVAKEFGGEMQATRFQDRDFSLTQIVIPRKHKTIRQLREIHERRKSVERTEEREHRRNNDKNDFDV